ncbi:hypothetical protein CYMTET_50271 [Cymbomonas tetramitiformis]|uniref:Nucleotide-diphospho-sugar transferase domain-containing protein n=1 Tax=Cymbomonas tetramitiformis TaxID=36881 RepID=A0AAE0ETV1_9CHLO|nr:hypothetical protein CYMTET_50271 [Cymbomonas tetramitiformis]
MWKYLCKYLLAFVAIANSNRNGRESAQGLSIPYDSPNKNPEASTGPQNSAPENDATKTNQERLFQEVRLTGIVPVHGRDCFPSTTSTACPSNEPTLYGSSELNASITAAASCTCSDGTLVLTVVNHGMADVMLTQFKSVNHSAPQLLDMWLVVALDHHALEECQRWWKHCVLDPALSQEVTMSDEHTFADGRDHSTSGEASKLQYTRICWRRVELMFLVLRLGFNVIFSDLDIAFLRDPRPFLRKDADLQFGASNMNAKFDPHDEATYSTFPGPLNAGFYHIRASNATQAFAMQWLEAGRQRVHEVGDTSFHEGKGTGRAGSYAIKEYSMRFRWFDPQFIPTDKDVYAKRSGPCSAAIFHAAPGSGHHSKSVIMMSAFNDMLKCESRTNLADAARDVPVARPASGAVSRQGDHLGEGDIGADTEPPTPDPGSGHLASASEEEARANLEEPAMATVMQAAAHPPPEPPFEGNSEGLCWPSDHRCPAAIQTVYGDDGLIKAFSTAGAAAVAEASRSGHKGMIVSVLHPREKALFDAWHTGVQEHLPHLAAVWVVVATDEAAYAHCKDKHGLCARDPGAAPYEDASRKGDDHDRLGDLLSWRLIELSTIAIQLNFTVTASSFWTGWLQDARPPVDEQDASAHFQMAIVGKPRDLTCNATAAVSCSLGGNLEDFFHLRSAAESLAFCRSWLRAGHESLSQHGRGGRSPPVRLAGRVIMSQLRNGLVYQHLDHRYFPGDKLLFTSINRRHRCNITIMPLLKTRHAHEIEVKASEQARYFSHVHHMWKACNGKHKSPSSHAAPQISMASSIVQQEDGEQKR